MIYVIILAVWLVGVFISYNKYIKNWDNKEYEKIIFSLIWPLILPLYGIYYLNK
jgi:hypothetical protein